MKPFMDKDFLLSTPTARTLFHEFAEKAPILDYHCHINPREIAEDRRFDNITQLWLGGDHYKWRLMRSFGVDEAYITGDASDKEKFFKWAEVLGKAIGNPLYHWSHLELQRYFGYTGCLKEKLEELDVSVAFGFSWSNHVNVTNQITEAEVIMENDKLCLMHGNKLAQRALLQEVV